MAMMLQGFGLNSAEQRNRSEVLQKIETCVESTSIIFHCEACTKKNNCPTLREACLKQEETGCLRTCALHGMHECVAKNSPGTAHCRGIINYSACPYRKKYLAQATPKGFGETSHKKKYTPRTEEVNRSRSKSHRHHRDNRYVLSVHNQEQLTEWKGHIQDIHFCTQPSQKSLAIAASRVRWNGDKKQGKITVPPYVLKRLQTMKWWSTFSNFIKDLVFIMDLRGFVFWNEDKKRMVKMMRLEAKGFGEIASLLFRFYSHKISAKKLATTFWSWHNPLRV